MPIRFLRLRDLVLSSFDVQQAVTRRIIQIQRPHITVKPLVPVGALALSSSFVREPLTRCSGGHPPPSTFLFLIEPRW